MPSVRASYSLPMSLWLLVPGALAVGVGIALVLASALASPVGSSDVAPTGRKARLRHRGPRNHRRGSNRPGSRSPGLPVLPSGRFWGVVAPFTPDDDLFGTIWYERGRAFSVPCEFIHIDRIAGQSWTTFDHTREPFARDDATEAQAYWWDPIPRLAEWRILDLGQ